MVFLSLFWVPGSRGRRGKLITEGRLCHPCTASQPELVILYWMLLSCTAAYVKSLLYKHGLSMFCEGHCSLPRVNMTVQLYPVTISWALLMHCTAWTQLQIEELQSWLYRRGWECKRLFIPSSANTRVVVSGLDISTRKTFLKILISIKHYFK